MPKKPTLNTSNLGSSASRALTCVPKRLAARLLEAAAKQACAINPLNGAPLRRLAGQIKGYKPTPMHIALVTSKYWGPAGVRLSVSFLESTSTALRNRILSHMNAWAQEPRPGTVGANVRFLETQGTGDVRIAFQSGEEGGYWSYVGTDIRSIDPAEPTMNLEQFSMSTPESEFVRVVRHEAGHTLGFPHEHMRRELVNRIDPAKAIDYFGDTQGWTPDEVRAQVLTPLEERSIMGTDRADQISIMCYEIPGEITRDGRPIIGGLDIDEQDYAFVGTIYPGATPPQAPVPPASPVDAADPSGGDGAATIQIATGGTRITVSVAASTGQRTTQASGDGGDRGAVGRPLRQGSGPRPFIRACIQASGANGAFDPNDPMSSIGVSAENVRKCYNNKLPKPGCQRIPQGAVDDSNTENDLVDMATP